MTVLRVGRIDRGSLRFDSGTFTRAPSRLPEGSLWRRDIGAAADHLRAVSNGASLAGSHLPQNPSNGAISGDAA